MGEYSSGGEYVKLFLQSGTSTGGMGIANYDTYSNGSKTNEVGRITGGIKR